MVFFVGLCLNILSIHVNASESCKSTACLIFYVVNGFGIVLDAAFLWFWWLKCLLYWRKWCAINQDWFITDTTKNHITMVTYTKKSKSQEGLNPVVEAFEIENILDGKVMVWFTETVFFIDGLRKGFIIWWKGSSLLLLKISHFLCRKN